MSGHFKEVPAIEKIIGGLAITERTAQHLGQGCIAVGWARDFSVGGVDLAVRGEQGEEIGAAQLGIGAALVLNGAGIAGGHERAQAGLIGNKERFAAERGAALLLQVAVGRRGMTQVGSGAFPHLLLGLLAQDEQARRGKQNRNEQERNQQHGPHSHGEASPLLIAAIRAARTYSPRHGR